MSSIVDFSAFEVLTFDCYGTLVDWESGIAGGVRAALGEPAAALDDDDLLERYAGHEAALEAGRWLPYRTVLADSLRGIASELGVEPEDRAVERFAASVGEWPLFPDSAAALARLAARFELGVITNCDDDLFAASNERLGRPFRWVVTAEQVRSYKPSLRNFEAALERIGRPRQRILHVAQSLYHDHVPAAALGIASAWINRRHARHGAGATPPALAAPDIVVPDMAAFADLALAQT